MPVASPAEYQRELRRRKAAAMADQQAVTGILAAFESLDSVESIAPNLRETYLLALLKRDAVIWKKHFRAVVEHGAPGKVFDETLSPTRAAAVKRVAKPKHGRNPHALRSDGPTSKRGATTYIPETPCAKCGTSLRYSSNWVCVECNRAKNERRYSGAKKLASAPATRPPAIGTLAGVPHTRRALGQQQPKNFIRKIYERCPRFASK
jgi:hypothetical protein